MADGGTDEEHNYFQPEFLRLVVDKLVPSDILDYLDSLPDEVVRCIREHEKSNVEYANKLLMKAIIDAPQENYENLCSRFLYGLEDQAYGRLLKAFRTQCRYGPQSFEKEFLEFLFKLSRVDFIERINPADFIPSLVHQGHLSERDKVNILGIQQRSKQCQEMFSVLERKNDDGAMIIYELLKEKYPELISKMDPGAEREELERKGIVERELTEEHQEDKETVSDEEYNSDYEKFDNEESEKAELNRKMPPLKLRKYQIELASPAVKGHNSIIYSNTGSGKTWVALHITREHLARDATGNAKVVFMARTNHLVRQQFNMFHRYLYEYQVFHLTKESEECLAMHELMDDVRVFFMTPQILLNNLNRKNVSITDFSLLFMDECHHTCNGSPFFKLMMKYMQVKKSRKELKLPQIIGMTATLGLSGGDSVTSALDSMIDICANLDVEEISTVKENRQEFEKFVSVPTHRKGFEKLGLKEKDPVKDLIEKYMERFENFFENDTNVLNRTDIKTVWEKRPLTREGLRYLQWVLRLQRAVTCWIDDDDDLSRTIHSATEYLQKFNSLLEINYLMDVEHVVSFARKNFHKYTEKYNREEMILSIICKEFERELKIMVECRRPQNDYLKTLRKALVEFAEKDDFRGIIFVQTRATTFALAQHLNEELEYLGYKVAPLVGIKSNTTSSGMSNAAKDETLDHFRSGKLNLLVATAVASEGIDIPNCNFVITYNYTGKSTKITQMSGRARAKGSIALHISDQDTLQKEHVGLAQSIVMQDAFEELCRMDKQERQKRINEIQTKHLQETELREMLEAMKERGKRTVAFHLKCRKCKQIVLDGDDIRVYSGMHRIVIDPNFVKRAELILIDDPATFDGIRSKHTIFCKKCHYKWGKTFIIQGYELPVIGVKGFAFYDKSTETTKPFKVWRDVPYMITRITESEFSDFAYESATRAM